MTYKLIGQRNLRKYTEANTSPTYAAAIEARQIVDSLCGVAWEKVAAQDATMTYHTEETVGEVDGNKIGGLEMNVRIRNRFDAALFCAGHAGGQHRAYANAAVYHYILPDGTLPKLAKLTANVTSDPYNSAGARIAILTNSSGVIPTNCNDCRTGDAHADGVAPRTVGENGNWFPTTADCVFSSNPGEGETALPTGGLQLQKHLFVFVLMESYSTVRGNWLEGCSFIRNLISIETDAAVPGWTDGDTIDTRDAAASSFKIARGGILPFIPSGGCTGAREIAVRADANRLVDDGGEPCAARDASGDKAASAVGRLYSMFYAGHGSKPKADVQSPAEGAYFRVLRRTEQHVGAEIDLPVDTDVMRIESSVLLIPFVVPYDFTPTEVRLDYSSLVMTVGAAFNVFLADGYLTDLDENILCNPGLYDVINPPFRHLGSITGGTMARFDLPSGLIRANTMIISGWLPPERVSVMTTECQGTGSTPFMPDVAIV